MGLMMKAIRKSMPKPVRKATRTMHQVSHPVSTTRKAMTPTPVKQATRAAFNVAHPLEAMESAVENAIVDALPGGTPKRRPADPRQSSTRPSQSTARVVSHDGYAEMPSRVTDAWLREAVPTFTQNGLATLVEELKRRGWTDAELATRVYPYAD